MYTGFGGKFDVSHFVIEDCLKLEAELWWSNGELLALIQLNYQEEVVFRKKMRMVNRARIESSSNVTDVEVLLESIKRIESEQKNGENFQKGNLSLKIQTSERDQNEVTIDVDHDGHKICWRLEVGKSTEGDYLYIDCSNEDDSNLSQTHYCPLITDARFSVDF